MAESHVFDQLPAYALGAVEEAEALQIATHLAHCAACSAELDTYQPTLESLALAVAEQTPAPLVKNRLLKRLPNGSSSRYREKPTWRESLAHTFRQPLTVELAFSLVMVVMLVFSNLALWVRLNQAGSDQEFRTVLLAGTANASGLLVIGHDGNLGTLVVDDLPVLDETHQYQLWLIKDGKRTSGGIFSTDQYGYGALAISAPEPLKSYQAVGITIEPLGGSPGPTGEKVMGGDL